MNQQYSIFTLSNGLRCVCRQTAGLVSYIGVAVNAGSRDESVSQHGLAHFVEHTLFKGTVSRKSWQVSSRMELIGGELNAYTSKEETVVYTNAPAGFEDRAVELLSDILINSSFPSDEVDREREVVIEEINSYLDSPSDSVFDEFEGLAYAGSGLAHNILGTAESVRTLGSSDCKEFVADFYTPSNMVIYCCSPVSPARFKVIAEKYFGRFERKGISHDRILPVAMTAFDERREKGNHQANTIVGTRLFGRNDPRRFALFLLNNYLGGPAMNSRLNRELREKRGYVYTVESMVSLMSDSGLLMIYFGSDPSTVDKCRKIIRMELDRLAQSPMKQATFDKIRRQYCGQLLVTSDHMESRAMALAKSLMYYGEVHDISTMTERMQAVTPEEMREVAEMIMNSPEGALTLV